LKPLRRRALAVPRLPAWGFAAAASALLALGLLAARPGGLGAVANAFVMEGSAVVTASLVSAAAWWRARHSSQALAWRLLAAAGACTALGSALSFHAKAVEGRVTATLGAGEIAFVVAYLLLAAAFARFFPPTASRRDVVRRLVDLVAATSILAAVAWILFLRDLGASPWASLPLAAYPALDIAVASAMVIFASEVEGTHRRRLLLMAGGVLLFLAGDLNHAYMVASGAIDHGSPFNLAWPLGYLLFGAAALAGPREDAAPAAMERNGRLASVAVYLPLAVLLPVASLDFLRGRGVDAVLFALGLAIVLSLAVRQVLLTTEIAASNRRLAAERERFRLAAAATRDVLWDWSIPDDRFLWGASIGDTFGLPLAGEHSGTGTWSRNVHPDDRARVLASFEGALHGGEPAWRAEYRFRRGGGDHAVVLDRAAIVRDRAGRAVRVVGAMTDITGLRAAQAQLAAKAAEAAQMKELAQLKTQFLNNAAHELSTPLTPLRLQMATLRRMEFSGAQRDALALLERNVDRLVLLVQDLLDASRLQAGRLRIVPRPVAPAQVVGDVVASFAEKASRQGVSLLSAVEDGPPATLDGARIHQVLVNLVHNALKFTPKGTVAVRARYDGGDLVLAVSDTGAGLAPEQVARLFQPFVQVHDVRTSTVGGTGLGLYVSKGIVDQHGGTIRCRSDGPGKGSTFEVVLPLQPRAAPDGAAGGEAAAIAPVAA
jgi:signal transduction histidine kinase